MVVGWTTSASTGSPLRDVPSPIRNLFDCRTFLSDTVQMTGAELIRKLLKLGRQRGVPVRFRAERGQGSHGTLYYGDCFTVVKDRRKELSPGLLAAMLKQLGLTRDDLR